MQCDDNEVREKICSLIREVKRSIRTGVENKTFTPEEETYFYWKIDPSKFAYTSTGVVCGVREGSYVTRPSWFIVSKQAEKLALESAEYRSLFEALKCYFPAEIAPEQLLSNLIQKSILKCVSGKWSSDINEIQLVESVLKDLRGEPVKSGALVGLQGVALETAVIDLPGGTILRRPTISDLEKEMPANYAPVLSADTSIPSAILNVSCLARSPHEVQEEVEKAVAILRLFKTGSVKWLSYKLYSDTVKWHFGGTLSSGDRFTACDTFLITKDEVEPLRIFWDEVEAILPRNFFRFEDVRTDHLAIAYTRYSDAALDTGPIERRIMTAVMGLEALFLEEKQELAYRVKMRISKCLYFLQYNPLEVKDRLADAYDVRNKFAHGSILDKKTKKKLESKYGDVTTLFKTVLDYLRVSIILTMVCTVEKSVLLHLIDASLVHAESEIRLRAVIACCDKLVKHKVIP